MPGKLVDRQLTKRIAWPDSHTRVRRAAIFTLPLLPLLSLMSLTGYPATSAASVITSGGAAPSAPSTSSNPQGNVNSPENIINSAMGTGGAASTSSTTVPGATPPGATPETPAQQAAIQAEEARLAARQAAQDQRLARYDRQARKSLNGMGGRYFLPPLPGPAYVRPMVNTQYQEQFPLSPHEIQWVKRQMQDDQYAIHKGAPLKIENPSLPVSLGPGAQVPTIHLAPGYVTTISVLGEDGSPWPVTSRQVGGGLSFSVSAVSQDAGAPSGKSSSMTTGAPSKKGAAHTSKGRPQPVRLPSNLLTITPKYFGSSSNLVLTLKDLSTPVMVNVVADGPHDPAVDGMVTLRVDRHGPDAPPPLYAPPPPSAVNPDLMLFLAKTPPQGAKALHASGGFGVRAWAWNHRVIVRTRIPLLSPAWTAEVRQDGATVYDLPKTRVLMLRDDMSAAGGSWQARTVLLSSVDVNDSANPLASMSQ
ncbi:MAG: DotH/IcmK family type IV secretion protein [Acidithiobacillus sp.]